MLQVVEVEAEPGVHFRESVWAHDGAPWWVDSITFGAGYAQMLGPSSPSLEVVR